MIALPNNQLPRKWGFTTIKSNKHHEWKVKSFEAECNIPEVYDEAVQNQPITDRKPLGFIPTKILPRPEQRKAVGTKPKSPLPVRVEKTKKSRRGLREVCINPWFEVMRAVKKRAKQKKLHDQLYLLWKRYKQKERKEKPRSRKASRSKSKKKVHFTPRPTNARPVHRKHVGDKHFRKVCKLIRRGIPEEQIDSQEVDIMDQQAPRRIFSAQKLKLEEVDQSALGKTVYLKEGTDLTVEQLENQVAMLTEVHTEPDPIDLDSVDIGEEGVNTPEEIGEMRDVLKQYSSVFHQGGQLPPQAKGVICDIDVQGHKPIN